ncbi:MAG: Calx-beta domain-containing protein, partial [Pseudomonadota bacterium]
TVSVPVILEYASESNAVIPYTFSGTAIQGTDFTSAGSLTIPAGQTTGNIQINIIDNLVINSNKTIVVNLGEPTGAHLGTSTTHTITVVDNDNQPTVTFTTASQSVSESVGTVTVNLSMSKTYLLDVTIPYTVNGTASNPADHNLSNGSVTISAGSTTGSFSFNVVNDTLDEPNETVIVSLGTIVNGNAGSPSSQTITIIDDDPTPTVQFSTATQSVSEGVGTVSVRVNLSAVSGYTVQVPFTVTGTASNPSDHSLSSGTLTISAGSSFVTTSFSVVDDSLYELNETVILTIGSPTNATASGQTVQTVTITNNDPAPVVSFTASSQSLSEGNSGSTVVNLTVQLNTVSGVNASIPFSVSGTATSGTDFSVSTSSPLVIPAGSTTGTITLSVTGDNVYENNETIILTLGSPTDASLGAATMHTITANNDDPVPTVSFSASAQTVTESANVVYVLFVMTNPSAFSVTIPYTVGGTASYPEDHGLQSGSTTITPGNTNQVFTFSVVNDAIAEATETVVISIGSVTNGTLGTPDTHTVSILDNDRKFSLRNTKLWLDASYGISKDGQNRLLTWLPRYSKHSIQFTNISSSIWQFLDWQKFPRIESRDWSFLEKIFRTESAQLDTDVIYTLHGDSEPELVHFRDMSSWMKSFRGDLAELIWITPDQSGKNTKEIEAYLKQKYSLQNES